MSKLKKTFLIISIVGIAMFLIFSIFDLTKKISLTKNINEISCIDGTILKHDIFLTYSRGSVEGTKHLRLSLRTNETPSKYFELETPYRSVFDVNQLPTNQITICYLKQFSNIATRIYYQNVLVDDLVFNLRAQRFWEILFIPLLALAVLMIFNKIKIGKFRLSK